MTAPDKPPHLVVLRGEPSAEELAALTAVLRARAAAAARAATETESAPEPVSGWRDRSRSMRGPVPRRLGPGAWRLSMR